MHVETDESGEDEEAEAGHCADCERQERAKGQRGRLQPTAGVEECPGRVERAAAGERGCEREEDEQREHRYEVGLVRDHEQLAVHHELPDALRNGPDLRVDLLMLGGRRGARDRQAGSQLADG